MTKTLVVIGASGDMARRLLFPALYRLEEDSLLDECSIRGFALEQWSRDEFRERVRDGIVELAGFRLDETVWQRFAAKLDYDAGELSAESLSVLNGISGDALFYLALPPNMFARAASLLAQAGLNKSDAGWRRLVIEKPFGTDLDSAVRLNQELHENWPEDSIFRIDHYLGKETVQNILVFRFANRFMEPVLNSAHVEYVQITAAETLGVEGRYRYYDGIGALRDMIQSHLMQLLALTAMEPPPLWDAEILQDHKVEVLRAVRAVRMEDMARGQYAHGNVAGHDIEGYQEEEGIESGSRTETFAALKLRIDNWRWDGVPFYLRSGKRMRMDLTEIVIQFREPPSALFQASNNQPGSNRLVFRLRPAESINLFARAREPGLELRTRELALHAPYATPVAREGTSYENLLLDVMEGDRTSFLRFDEVEWAWRILAPVLDAWRTGTPEPYAAGSDGPQSQDKILDSGHSWRPLTLEGPSPELPAWVPHRSSF